jgi:hypothetical protein
MGPETGPMAGGREQMRKGRRWFETKHDRLEFERFVDFNMCIM